MSVSGKDHVVIWQEFLAIIKDNIPSSQAYETWFLPIKPVKFENNTLTIQVPTSFYYEWIEEHYISLLRKCVHKVINKDAKLEYIILIDNSSDKGKTTAIPSSNFEGDAHKQTVKFPFQLNSDVETPFAIPGHRNIQIDSQLNPKYTFDNFLEGECNKFARNAGLSIATNLSKTSFNPLFVYSNLGLGKTHLVNAIGNELKKQDRDLKVLYVTSEQFTQHFVEALQKKVFNDFLNLYQSLDVLIIDDIYSLAGKTKTQDIFFQIFNHLYQNNKQLIVTCDKPIKDVKGLEERIISRLKWGLTINLMKPDFELRKDILKSKIKEDGVEVESEIVDYLARYIDSNVRELEGAWISLLALSTYEKQDISIDLAKKTVFSLVKNAYREIDMNQIEKIVCSYFDMTPEAIKSTSRKREIVEARQISMYFSRMMTKHSLKNIGKFFERDHATVIYSCESVRDLVSTDSKFKNHVEEIEKRIRLSV